MKNCESLDIKSIKQAIKTLNNKSPHNPADSNKGYKKAAVLVPFVCDTGKWSLLYTRRSEKLINHSGQVSFPGGAMEPQDQSLISTALRETYEEIGIHPDYINVLGVMPDFQTISDFVITPIVVYLDWPVKLTISEDEVKRVFTIPVGWLKNPKNWEERIFSHPSGWYGTVYFYEPYDGELLWGISAKITIELIRELTK